LTYDNRISRRTVLGGVGSLGLLAACQTSSAKFDADIIILGAGLSGLYAAHLMASEGKDVLVLEGSNRIGGRMHTIYQNGYHTEAGGEQIGASYARILDRARELNISLRESAGEPSQTAYHYRGQSYAPEKWKTFAKHPLPAPFEGASPGGALFGVAGRNNPLQSPGDWRNPNYNSQDISARKFLTKNGLDETALGYIEHALNANELGSYSIMNVYRSLYLYRQSSSMGPSVYVEGGVQKLLKAMGQAQNVKTGQTVKAIEVDDEGVTINTDSGRIFRAQTCICSLPFGGLRHIEINAPMTPVQKQAISGLPYTQILQVHFETGNAYWENDGLPANMWTDTPIERIFANRNLDGDMTGLARMWINGAGARDLQSKSDEDIKEVAQYWVDKVRPSAGKLNIYHIQRWTRNNPRAGGAYMHWAPGQIRKWAESMGASAGRLHFCGEHLSHLHTGMEGAMESAEMAAFHLLEI